MILYIRIRTANRVFVAWRKKKSIQSASLYSHCIIEGKCSSGKACGFECRGDRAEERSPGTVWDGAFNNANPARVLVTDCHCTPLLNCP